MAESINKSKLVVTWKIEEYKNEIHKRNCRNFVTFAKGGTIITGTILLVGLLLSNYTGFVIEYGMFFGYLLIMNIVARHCEKVQAKHINLIYYLMLLPIMTGGIMMGTFLDPDEPALTIMILMCTLTLFIIDKPLNIITYLLTTAAIFAVCCYFSKTTELFIADMVDLLIYLCISIGVNYFSLRDRVDSAENYCLVIRKSQTDALTGLYNRGYGESKVKELVKEDGASAFAIMDIDNFKQYNDTYGHQIGDAIICRVGEVLMDNFKVEDVVFRLGGDEFAVYVRGKGADNEMAKLKKRFDNVENQLKGIKDIVNNMSIDISLSIGCSFFVNEEVDFEKLYKRSDKVLYDVKNSGKGRYIIVPYDKSEDE